MNAVAAPKGFVHDEWDTFLRDGILVLPKRLPKDDLDLAKRVLGALALASGTSLRLNHFVGLCPEMARFIDHPDYVGYVYEVYGESLRLLSSQGFVRPTNEAGDRRNDWHFDGPRILPFDVFSSLMPLRIKVGLFLTELSEENWGNLVYVPGSHRWAHIDQYKTHEAHPQERQLIVPSGSIVLMFSGLWHRVAENLGPQTRKNIYVEYGPSWLQPSESQLFTKGYVQSLSREQRIVLRLYDDPNLFYKPPPEDVPLYANSADYVYGESVTNDLRRYTPKVRKRHD